MASEERKEESQQEQGTKEGQPVKKAFLRRKKPKEGGGDTNKKGRAHIPSTVMTVEYIDAAEGMDAALNSIEERLAGLEKQLGSLQEANREMVSAINRQAKEIQELVGSVTRRMDRIYKGVAPSVAASEPQEETPALPSAEGIEEGVPEQFSEDTYHQQAWRIARVLAADLEAYYPDKVREGVLYGNFHELLSQPIEEARKTYEQRVPEKVPQQYDYFSRALDALIARKSRELAEESSP